MTGPSPLIATHRVVFRYHADTFGHKCQMYSDAVASADPSGYDLLAGHIGVSVGFSTVVDPFFTYLAGYYNPARDTFDGADLYKRTGTVYSLLASVVPTVVPTGATASAHAWGMDITGKSVDNKTIHFYLYESGNFAAAVKINSYAAGGGFQPLMNALFNSGGTAIATDPWNYRVTREDTAPTRMLALVADTNQKLRRMRRIA